MASDAARAAAGAFERCSAERPGGPERHARRRVPQRASPALATCQPCAPIRRREVGDPPIHRGTWRLDLDGKTGGHEAPPVRSVLPCWRMTIVSEGVVQERRCPERSALHQAARRSARGRECRQDGRGLRARWSAVRPRCVVGLGHDRAEATVDGVIVGDDADDVRLARQPCGSPVRSGWSRRSWSRARGARPCRPARCRGSCSSTRRAWAASRAADPPRSAKGLGRRPWSSRATIVVSMALTALCCLAGAWARAFLSQRPRQRWSVALSTRHAASRRPW